MLVIISYRVIVSTTHSIGTVDLVNILCINKVTQVLHTCGLLPNKYTELNLLSLLNSAKRS